MEGLRQRSDMTVTWVVKKRKITLAAMLRIDGRGTRAEAGRPVKRPVTGASGLGWDNGSRKVVRSGQIQDIF